MKKIIGAELCPRCQIDHALKEKRAKKKLAYVRAELCLDCKRKLGLTEHMGNPKLKKQKKIREKKERR